MEAADKSPEQADLRSVCTASFPAILTQHGISLLVSTYQAQAIVVRPRD